MMAEKLSASIRLRLKSDIEQRTQEIVARIRELEAVVKEGGSSGEQAARQQALEFKRLARAVRDGERAERDMAKAERVLGGASAQLTAQTQGLESATRQSTAAVVQGAQTWTGFVKANMAAEMKRTGSHAAAMTSIGKMWKEQKKLTTATRGATAAIKAEAVALNTVGKSAKKSAGGLRLVSKSSQNTGRELGGLVNVVAETGYSFGTAIPAFRGVGTQLAMMGGSAYQLGAAFGVFGVAAAVVIGILPSLISLFGGASEEEDRVTGSTRQMNSAIRTHLGLVDQEVAKARAQRREEELLAGQRDIEETRANLRVARRAREQAGRGAVLGQMQNVVGESAMGRMSQEQRDRLQEAFIRANRRGESVQARQFVAAGLGAVDAGAAAQRASGSTALEQDRIARIVAPYQADLEAAQRATSVATQRHTAEQQRQAAEDVTSGRSTVQTNLKTSIQRAIEGIANRGLRSRVDREFRAGRLSENRGNLLNRAFGDSAGQVAGQSFQLDQIRRARAEDATRELIASNERLAAANERLAAANEADRQIHVTVDPGSGTGGVAPDNSSRLGGAE